MAEWVMFLRERDEVGRGRGESCMKSRLVDMRGEEEEGEKAGVSWERSSEREGGGERREREGREEVREAKV
jgi:hypothetical protein